MLNKHSKVGIAQIAFYAPIVPLAMYLLRRHGRPRQAWILIFLFSLIRITGGVVVILLENKPDSKGLLIAASILLGVGVPPFLVATLGLLRIIRNGSFESRKEIVYAIKAVRILFVAAIACIATSGPFISNYQSANSLSTGEKLLHAGYAVLLVIFLVLISFQIYMWTQIRYLTARDKLILKGMAVAVPFIAIRIVYAFLSAFSSATYLRWNGLFGDIAAYVVMGLLMEYVVMVIYATIGVVITSGKQIQHHEEAATALRKDSIEESRQAVVTS